MRVPENSNSMHYFLTFPHILRCCSFQHRYIVVDLPFKIYGTRHTGTLLLHVLHQSLTKSPTSLCAIPEGRFQLMVPMLYASLLMSHSTQCFYVTRHTLFLCHTAHTASMSYTAHTVSMSHSTHCFYVTKHTLFLCHKTHTVSMSQSMHCFYVTQHVSC